MVGSAAVAEIGVPTEIVGFATPQRESVQQARGGIHAVIEHRVFQVLEGDMIVTLVAPTERESGGESATRAAAGYADAARVDTQVARVIDDVTQARVAIIEWK